MEGLDEFLGDPFAGLTGQTGTLCQLCERRGHSAKNCPTLHKGEKEESNEKEQKLQLWRIASDSKRFLTADESGDVKLAKGFNIDGWEEWELSRTEQHDGNPIVTIRSHHSGAHLFAFKGNKSKIVCQKDINHDMPEIYFTMQTVEGKKKLLGSKKPARAFKTHHNTYMAAKGKTLTCSEKHPDKEKSLQWHLYEVLVPAELRSQLHLQAQEFHLPHDLDTSNPHLPVLAVDYDLQFQLSEKMFKSVGNADITDPDNRVWFKVGRIGSRDVSLSGEAGRLGLNNARGEPLVFLQDLSKPGMLKYALSRIVKCDSGLKCVPRATIERTEQMLGANYQIFLSDGRSITLNGSISDIKTTFKDPISNEVLCTISRKFSLRSGCYGITIKKGQDVMMYLAYAVAIDKMHHEAAKGGASSATHYLQQAYNYGAYTTINYGTYGKCNACELAAQSCRCFLL